jgi:hypothetical protein
MVLRLEVVRQVAAAMAYLHSNNVIVSKNCCFVLENLS